MIRHESGAAVKSGYYFNPITMNVVPIARDGARLPEGKGTWLAIPAVAALALTPILGALFLMFLPMIGIVLALQAAGQNLAALAGRAGGDLAVAMAPGLVAGEAHLTGTAGEKKAAGGAEGAPELEELESEIEAKRNA